MMFLACRLLSSVATYKKTTRDIKLTTWAANWRRFCVSCSSHPQHCTSTNGIKPTGGKPTGGDPSRRIRDRDKPLVKLTASIPGSTRLAKTRRNQRLGWQSGSWNFAIDEMLVGVRRLICSPVCRHAKSIRIARKTAQVVCGWKISTDRQPLATAVIHTTADTEPGTLM
jgi:hypothetical protein